MRGMTPSTRERKLLTYIKYIEGGSLDKYLNTTPVLGMRIRLKIALEVAKGMMFLHENELLHLDLKPPNFLVSISSIYSPTNLMQFSRL